MRKHGGEKGVPFRIQIDTFKENENEEYTEHLHSASCQFKVFKVRGMRERWRPKVNIYELQCTYLVICDHHLNGFHMTCFSLKVQTESRRLTGRRWRRGHHRKRKSISPPMKPQS